MELVQFLFGMFLGYYVLSKRLRKIINKSVLWFFTKWHTQTLPLKTKGVLGSSTIDSMGKEFNAPKFESSKTIKGVIVSPEDFERLMANNPELKAREK